jgi:thiosulfate dehydrogenase (quinone) large subunit
MTATHAQTPMSTAHAEPARRPVDYVWAIARISIGWIFLWAFLDKTFGWGFATPAAKSWINGGSPTTGFLKGSNFAGLAGQPWVDWLFMLGLAAIGAALVLGIGTRIAAATGGLMLVLMWAAELPLANNPFMDEHLIYAIVLIGLAMVGAGNTIGLGRLPIVQRNPYLK